MPMSVSLRENNKQLNRLAGTGRERETEVVAVSWQPCEALTQAVTFLPRSQSSPE